MESIHGNRRTQVEKTWLDAGVSRLHLHPTWQAGFPTNGTRSDSNENLQIIIPFTTTIFLRLNTLSLHLIMEESQTINQTITTKFNNEGFEF